MNKVQPCPRNEEPARVVLEVEGIVSLDVSYQISAAILC